MNDKSKAYRMKNRLTMVLTLYWLATLILYAYGPFSWTTYQPVLFWGLNFSYIVLFIIGTSFDLADKVDKNKSFSVFEELWVIKRLQVCVIINLFYEIINLFRIHRLKQFDIRELINSLLFGMNNMGIAYSQVFDDSSITSGDLLGGRFFSIFNYCWEIFSFTALLLCFIYYKKLKIMSRVFFLSTIFVIIVNYTSRGTNIGVFRLVFALVLFAYFKNLKSCKIKKITIVLFIAVALVIVLFYFNKTMVARGGILSWQSNQYNIGGVSINKESIFFSLLPIGLHRLLVAMAGYLTQGYYGMSLSLRVEWLPTFGVGNSMFVLDMLKKIGFDIESFTYQQRIEQFGWENKVRWHTLYSWVANDISYCGVLFFMLAYGFLFRQAINDIIRDDNPYAKIILYYFFLMGIFLPCNNQIAQTSYVFLSFIYCFIKWRLTRKGVKIRIGKSIYL